MTSLDVSPGVGLQGGTSRLGIAGVHLTIAAGDLRRIESMAVAAPGIVVKRMRDAFGQFAGSHRRLVLQSLAPNYQRLAKKSLFYRARPRQTMAALARASLDDVRMRIWATSRVTLLHETGGTVTGRNGYMAIPVERDGTTTRRVRRPGVKNSSRGPTTPAGMRAAGIELIRLGKRLYRVDKTKTGKERLTVTHLLTGAVHIKPALGILRSWRALEQDRRRRLQASIDAAAREMASHVRRSAGRAVARILRSA